MIIFSHCFWEKCASWMEFCICLTPFISLSSSLKLTWLQLFIFLAASLDTARPAGVTNLAGEDAIFTLFDLYTLTIMSVLLCFEGFACIVERTSNVLELLGDLVLMMAACCKLSCCVIKHVTSGPVTIHLLSAAGSPDTPNAPLPALTTALACSRAWSINKANKNGISSAVTDSTDWSLPSR